MGRKFLIGTAVVLVSTAFAGLAAANHSFSSFGSHGFTSFGHDPFFHDSFLRSSSDLCDPWRFGGSVFDLNRASTFDTSFRRTVDLDEDTVLLGIALDRAGFFGVDFEDLVSSDTSLTRTVAFEQESDLDRNDVLAAIALGAGRGGLGLGGHGLVSCGPDIRERSTFTQRHVSDVFLDEDEVLLGIALSSALGHGLGFWDIADRRIDTSSAFRLDRDFDLDREDALLLLALGA